MARPCPGAAALFENIVRAAVAAADDVPVTVKTRVGIDAGHHTYLEAGQIAQDAGAAAITLHCPADQLYSGTADWSHIARLVETVDIPVLGNGDIGRPTTRCAWSPRPAARASSSAAAAWAGRGCSATWPLPSRETPERALPTLREVAAVMHRHADAAR